MMSRCKLRNLLLLVCFVSFLPSCGTEHAAGSNIEYLTNGDYTCNTPTADRINYIKSLPQGFITNYSGSQMDVAISRVAGIPDRDLNHLLWTFKSGKLSGIKGTFTFFGVAGVTYLSYGKTQSGFGGSVATSITTGSNQAGFALQHEIGHAVEIVAREAAQNTNYKNFDSALGQLHSELLGNGSIRGYAKSSPSESWAEAYANWYCSPDSHAFIQQHLPTTYQFLSAVLMPPLWESGANPNNSSDAIGGSTTPVPPTVTQTPTPNNNGATTGNPFIDWLRKLLSRFLGGSHQMMADAAPTTASPITSSAGPAEMTVALFNADPASGVIGLTFSSTLAIQKVLLCLEDDATCRLKTTLAPEDMAGAANVRAESNGRRFYDIKPVTGDQRAIFQHSWTLLGYDANNQLVATRRVGFSNK